MAFDSANISALNRLRLPDLWQQEALQALREGQDVIIDAPTGAGKTYVFEIFAREKQRQGQLVYTVPTRALANDKFMEWKRAGWQVGIATGDIALDTDAPVLVATLETQRERLLEGHGPALLVVDEYQMLGDQGRGAHYETAIALAPMHTRLLLLSGSVANPGDVGAWLERLGRPCKIVRTSHRPVPLDDHHVAGLARPAPPSVTGFFPRLAYGVCLSELAPLLIFAPHRAMAEKVARQIAGAMPDDLPLILPSDLREHCPADLRPLLAKRIAFHHSGLPYAARAGIIEPLAKAGQLRVIVATMGLAAGINFSVRSVFVSARSYRDGPFEKSISADELLQMFGRAGRRGLDEAGTVLSADDTPRLSDGRQARLARQPVLDWPCLLRVMARAADADEDPLAAASRLVSSLFTATPPVLGWETDGLAAGEPAGDDSAPFARAPEWKEMLNASGQWERPPAGPELRPLTRCLLYENEQWGPALRSPGFLASLARGTRPVKIVPSSDPRRWRYGLEMIAATLEEGEIWKATRPLRALVPGLRTFTMEDWEKKIRRRFLRGLPGFAIFSESHDEQKLHLRLDAANVSTEAWQDGSGQFLIAPPFRMRRGGTDWDIIDPATGESRSAAPGSPARAWRRLGLIDSGGRPTPRGRIASLFQRGEGLAIAAALEDATYPIEELVWHLANLRAGHRFSESSTGESARLAAACRRAYGSLDYPGYLELGLPPGYGDGAGEVLVRSVLERKAIPVLEVTPGDLGRARVEWLSLLRHIVHARELPDARWAELRAVARHLLAQFGKSGQDLAPLLSDPPIWPEVNLRLRKRS
ncbi:MAG: DEAD/DEAH box helicase [Verrucomicrobiales bacterium]